MICIDLGGMGIACWGWDKTPNYLHALLRWAVVTGSLHGKFKVSVQDTEHAGTCRELRFQWHTALCAHEDCVRGISDHMVP